jgi:hypothetical protein
MTGNASSGARARRVLGVVLLLVMIGLMSWGLLSGNLELVFQNAVRICLSCMGIQ